MQKIVVPKSKVFNRSSFMSFSSYTMVDQSKTNEDTQYVSCEHCGKRYSTDTYQKFVDKAGMIFFWYEEFT